MTVLKVRNAELCKNTTITSLKQYYEIWLSRKSVVFYLQLMADQIKDEEYTASEALEIIARQIAEMKET